jgi:hypothetical protein
MKPGGRKAATAIHSIFLLFISTFLDGTKALLSSSHPTGILPGRVKSWLPFGRGTNSEEWGRRKRSPDRPNNFNEG